VTYRIVTVTTDQMVVHQSGRLHEGVADRRSDKTKATLFQRFRKGIRFRSAGRNVALTTPSVLFRCLFDEAPDEPIETAELFLDGQQRAGIADGALDLEAIANDGGVGEQGFDAPAVESCDACRIEIGKGSPITVALVEDRLPGEPGLGTLQHQKLEQPPIVMKRNAPFLIVIGKHARIAAGPVATEIFFCGHDCSPAIIARGESARQSRAGLLRPANACTMIL
jgi:hypothetical protein